MNVKILASGSSGNCIHIQSGSTSILVDIGLPKTKAEKVLIENGIDPTGIDAILITHAHGDHIKGLPLANKYRIPVHATHGEWNGISGVDDDLKREVSLYHGVYESLSIGVLRIFPFKTHHDAYEPVAYTMDSALSGATCSILLDTGHVDGEMLKAMARSDIYIMEANHEPAVLEVSNYPASVKARILSDIGHLSNEQAAEALAKLVQGRGERIYLTHLSSTNNSPELAAITVKRALTRKGLLPDRDYILEVV